MADDYYVLLGITPAAGRAEVRRAWRRLALQWHPDRAGATATATFQKIQAAYAVLADPISRAAYDRRRAVPPPVVRARTPPVRLARVSGPLAGLLACGVVRRAGNDILELVLNAEEASTGGMVTIAMRVPVRCPACAAAPTTPCDKCAGRRVVDDLFSAWLAVPPGVTDGEILPPSALLPGMLHRVWFRVRVAAA